VTVTVLATHGERGAHVHERRIGSDPRVWVSDGALGVIMIKPQ